AYVGLEDGDHSLDDLNTAVALDPKNPRGYFERGNLFQLGMDYQLAIDEYNIAISISPDDPDYYINRANSYADLFQYDKAIADYDQGLKLNPHDERAAYNKAYIQQCAPRHNCMP